MSRSVMRCLWRLWRTPLLRLVPLLVAAASLPAQQPPPLQALFAGYDADRNGILTRAEFPGSDEQWKALDQNRDGRVTPQEFAASALARELLAAAAREAGAPRPRLADAPALEARIAAALAACDGNRDGRVERAEWNGAPLAFAGLDLDGDGVIGTSDLRLAHARAAAAAAGAASGAAAAPAPPSEVPTVLPRTDELLRRLDADRDQQLTRGEVGAHRLAAWFAFADRNADGMLDRGEIDAVVGYVDQRIAERNAGSARQRAFVVPFSGWDKNRDGRLEYDEFLEQKQLFARIDADRDGFVTPAEIERWRRALEGETFLERFDLNGDGRVTLEEFGGSAAAFQRADRNGDGIVDRTDQ